MRSQADPAVISRSADYTTPSAITLLTGERWLDGTQNTGGADDFNEAEAAYVLGLDPNPGQGLRFRIDGAPTGPRYSPFFKIRQWRSLVETPVVRLNGTLLVKDAAFRAAVKPVSRAHMANWLAWHHTGQDGVSPPEVGTGGGGVLGSGAIVSARYGNGLSVATVSNDATTSPRRQTSASRSGRSSSGTPTR